MQETTKLAIVVSIAAATAASLTTHFLNRMATKHQLVTLTNEAHDEGWHKGFSDGWEGAGDNFSYLKTRYEHFVNTTNPE